MERSQFELIGVVKTYERREKIRQAQYLAYNRISFVIIEVPARKQYLWAIKLIFKCAQTLPTLIKCHLGNANCPRYDIDELPKANCRFIS